MARTSSKGSAGRGGANRKAGTPRAVPAAVPVPTPSPAPEAPPTSEPEVRAASPEAPRPTPPAEPSIIQVQLDGRSVEQAVLAALGQRRTEIGGMREGPQARAEVHPGMQVSVRISVVGSRYRDTPLLRGRVFKLIGGRNDERLVRLGYVVPFNGTPVKCRECGADFDSLASLNAHGDKAHKPEPRPEVYDLKGLDPRERALAEADIAARALARDEAADKAEDRRILEETPPYWDRTAASASA